MHNSLLLAFFFIGVSIFYTFVNRRDSEDEDSDKYKQQIIDAWNRRIIQPNVVFKRICIGINANVDLIVPGLEVLQSLDIDPGGSRNLPLIHDMNELQDVFHYFFSRGAAVERPFANQKNYRELVASAAVVKNSTWYIGGNAALMAQNIVTKFADSEVHLVGPVGPRLEQLLNSRVQVPSACRVAEDEVHLILEYSVGQVWGESVAPVATRFITSYDETNGKAALTETFFSVLSRLHPDLAVFTGLHLLESQPEELWTERIHVITSKLKEIPVNIALHLELASMVNIKFVRFMLDKVLTEVTSLGLNEQELSFASKVLGGPHGDFLHDGALEVYTVTDTLSWIVSTYGYSSRNPSSRLTRVHFHSLTFHVMAASSLHWTNIVSAVAAGARTAGFQACDSSSMQPHNFHLKIPTRFLLSTTQGYHTLDHTNPIVTWEIDPSFIFAFSPVLVCKRPSKTVGLGDAISAVGLLYSQYIS